MKNNIYRFLKKRGYKIENQGKQYKKDVAFLAEFYTGDRPKLLTRAMHFVQPLREMYADLKIEDENEGYLLRFNDLTFYIETYEELLVVHEVFVSKDYHFYIPGKVLVFDIGGNIGLSSLFFAQMPNVEKIVSFEPVTPTFEQARKNHQSNPNLIPKIEALNIGLADRAETTKFLFNPNVKGNTGVRAEQSTSFVREQSHEVEVRLEEASTVLDRYISDHSDCKVVVKMDCEGGEYAIFDNLFEKNTIDKVSVFMIEYHDRGSENLVKILMNKGFSYFNQAYTKNTGMLYAYK